MTPPPPCGSCPAHAGAVVFHRYLQDLNKTPFPSAPPYPIAKPPAIHREPDSFEPSTPARPNTPDHPAPSGPALLPRLGEVLPVTPEPQPRTVVETPRPIQRQLGSGRMVDLLA